MKWSLLCWLVLSLVFYNITCHICQNAVLRQSKKHVSSKMGRKGGLSNTRSCMEEVNNVLENGNDGGHIEALATLEQVLEETEVNETTSLSVSHLVAVLHKPRGPFTGLEIHANENEARSDKAVPNSKVSVRLPRELDAGSNNTVIFCMLTWPEANWTLWGASDELYESRLVGLSVRGKKISGLQERVNITVALSVNENQVPSCVFFNFSTKDFSNHGCLSMWERGQSHITCSCDHLTYFGVLMVSSPALSTTHLKILTYITLIGCSLSLFALVITVLLFITYRSFNFIPPDLPHISSSASFCLSSFTSSALLPPLFVHVEVTSMCVPVMERNGGNSEEFNILAGVLQGDTPATGHCPLPLHHSPKLFAQEGHQWTGARTWPHNNT
ncbi:adhesion G-protein coupled receptor G1 isoform X2 [Cottoperca gobio]|uniref:Adhesion G-protein coupled receptor G1 isoform X2 n=1 Tax=Cottoperca gobio TaxID=56716 RepID=A0A6J2P7Y5_COTGO|nr:adhesion G-protein coupled receptor G1-like isoform X2 [Cottoperca gobio]